MVHDCWNLKLLLNSTSEIPHPTLHLQVCIYNFPFSTVVRVWDIFLAEGVPHMHMACEYPFQMLIPVTKTHGFTAYKQYIIIINYCSVLPPAQVKINFRIALALLKCLGESLDRQDLSLLLLEAGFPKLNVWEPNH